MDSAQVSDGTVNVRVENIGGIDETAVSFDAGATVLAGRNATNRTSLLRAVMAALGSDDVSLKGDAEEGFVRLEFGGETYTRRLSRRGDRTVFDGDPYLEDATVADLFAFLLETNDARLAVRYDEDLRDAIMAPVDTEAIQAEIERLESERDDVEEELEELEALSKRLPELEERRHELERKIEERRDDLAEVRADIEAADADIEERRERESAVEAKFEEIEAARSELESVRSRIETQRESLAALEERREELEADLESTEAGDRNLEEIEGELDRLRERKRRLDSEVNDLQNVIAFNREMLDETNQEVLSALDRDDGDGDGGGGSVTDRLLESNESTVCWTCGTTVETEQIQETVDRLRELRQAKVDERREVTGELDELKSRRDAIRTRRERRRSLERELDEVEADIEERTERLAELESERDALTERVDELEAEAEALESEQEDFGTLRELHREASEVEVEIETLEADLEAVEEEIASVEERLASRDRLEARREEIREGLTERRTRIERLEERTVEKFNDHMDELLDVLDYENLDRIWLERVQREVREGRRTVERSAFELHVVRTTDDGVAYEDTVEHLSESEREVTGLVFALAGYLAHEAYEAQPFVLLDSLEAIDADRIALLVEHFEEYAEYLLVALLPEDAASLDDSYRRVTEI